MKIEPLKINNRIRTTPCIFAENLIKMKIAIAGLPKSNKTLLAMALSNMTDIPYIRSKTMLEWYRIFSISNSVGLNWKDALLIASSSFFERSKIESYYDQCISDGASFSELMWLKSNFAERFRKRMKNERINIIESLEHMSLSYAASRYDFVLHAETAINAELSNDRFIGAYSKYHIPYKIYNTDCLERSLIEISTDLNLSMKNTVENSIHAAKLSLFLKNE